MSSTPTRTSFFSMLRMRFARRCAIGMPRRLMPTRPRLSTPLAFSTISWASRTSVRSISLADIRRDFSRNFGVVGELIAARHLTTALRSVSRAASRDRAANTAADHEEERHEERTQEDEAKQRTGIVRDAVHHLARGRIFGRFRSHRKLFLDRGEYFVAIQEVAERAESDVESGKEESRNQPDFKATTRTERLSAAAREPDAHRAGE